MIDSDHNYKNITIKDAFSISSNVAISKIINNNYKDNPEQYTDRIYQMGLSKALDLELPYPNNLKMPIAYKKLVRSYTALDVYRIRNATNTYSHSCIL